MSSNEAIQRPSSPLLRQHSNESGFGIWPSSTERILATGNRLRGWLSAVANRPRLRPWARPLQGAPSATHQKTYVLHVSGAIAGREPRRKGELPRSPSDLFTPR